MTSTSPYPQRTEKLPTELDGVTSEWLNKTLQLRYPELEILSMDFVKVINTHTTKIRASLSLNDAAKQYDFPEHVCLKANWSGSPLSSHSGICELEARFYHFLRDELTVPAPRCYFADWDNDEFNQGMAVLEDLEDSSVTFCQASEPLDVDEIARSLEGFARMHSSCWGGDLLQRQEWLKVSMSANCSDATLYQTLEPHMLDNNQQADRQAVLPAWFQEEPQRLRRAYDALAAFESNQQAPRCLIHGDAHSGNSYVTTDGERRWLDWQIVRKGTPWRDLNYFMTSSMIVKDRRNSERNLLKHYLDAMKTHGCEMPTFDQAWDQYCLWPIHGLASFNGSRDEWQFGTSIFDGVERFSAAIEDQESIKRMSFISGKQFF